MSDSGGPRGYTAGPWSCTGGTLARKRLAVPNGAHIICSVTNSAQQPTLTLIKVVRNGNTGASTSATAWQLSAVGPRTISGVSDSAAVTQALVPVGTYDLTQSSPAGFRPLRLGVFGCGQVHPGRHGHLEPRRSRGL